VLTYIARRLVAMFGLLVALSIVTFLLFSALPADPAALTCGKSCTPEVIQANRVRLGLDKRALHGDPALVPTRAGERAREAPPGVTGRIGGDPVDRAAAVAACREATLAGRDHFLEYRVVAADGRTVWIHDTARVVADADGTVRRIAELIRVEWGVALSPSHVSRLLKLGRLRRRALFRTGREGERPVSLTYPRNARPRRTPGTAAAQGAAGRR